MECSDEDKDTGLEKCLQFPLDLQRSIDEVIRMENFISCEVSKKSITTAGGNYMGDLYAADLKGESNKGHKEIHLFIKSLSSYDNIASVISVKDMYVREIFVYTALSTHFTDVQIEAKIPIDEMITLIKFYDTGNNRLIIMDNKTKEGYTVFDRFKVVSYDYAVKAVTELAKFHAMSFVLENRRPEFYESKIKQMNFLFNFNEDYDMLIQSLCKHSIEVLYTKDAKRKLKRYTDKIMNKYKFHYKNPEAKICTVCHGDYRVSNLMMLEKEGKIEHLVPIDFQTIYYGKPIDDFLYFIFGATDQKFRRDHLKQLKDLYFDSMKNFLNYFNIDIEYFYPRKEFEKDYVERLDFGILVGIHLLPFILAPEKDVIKENLSTLSVAHDDLYIKRTNELVDDFIEWGYLV